LITLSVLQFYLAIEAQGYIGVPLFIQFHQGELVIVIIGGVAKNGGGPIEGLGRNRPESPYKKQSNTKFG
jgi:hypothetical protein